MIRVDDYTYAQLKAAFETVLGRVGLIILAALGGFILGGLSATRSIGGIWMGIIGLPSLSVASIFYGVGLFVFPVLLIYAIVSVRWEWPLRLTLLCTLLMWWNIHKTIRWTVYDSSMAKQQQQFQAELERGVNEALQKANRKNPK
jgi:hypothetical protein